MRYAFAAAHRTQYPLGLLCRVLRVSASGFHDYLRRMKQSTAVDADAGVRAELRSIHTASRRTYGRRRLVKELRARNHRIGPKRVARLMAQEQICGKIKGGFKRRSAPAPSSLPANLLERRFDVGSGLAAWVGDITYIPTKQGWLYLAVVVSVQTRQVLGYSVSSRITEELVVQAFNNAWGAHPQTPGLIFHSDRGGQYIGAQYQLLLQRRGVVQSVSRPGNCWDNAVVESFFATLKAEEASGVYPTQEEAGKAITNYILGFYNPARLHSTLGYQSPNSYARQLNAAA